MNGACYHRCACGTLLGIQRESTLHLKYKQFSAAVCGRAEIRCRRCQRTLIIITA